MFRIFDVVFCSADKAKAEKNHATALKQAEDEVATLKSQLAEINDAHKIEMEHVTSEKTWLEEEAQQLRQAAETSEEKARLAQEAAQRFQARIDAWAVEFKRVQDNMHGEANFRDTLLFDLSELSLFSPDFVLMLFWFAVQKIAQTPLLVLLRLWLSFGR